MPPRHCRFFQAFKASQRRPQGLLASTGLDRLRGSLGLHRLIALDNLYISYNMLSRRFLVLSGSFCPPLVFERTVATYLRAHRCCTG